MINYGENLKFHRECAGLNQPELAKQLGISQANISRWESGAVLPNIEFCIKLADFYGITIDELLGITDDFGARIPAGTAISVDAMRDTNTAQERELLELFRTLSPYLQGLTLDTVRGWAGGASDKSLHKKA